MDGDAGRVDLRVARVGHAGAALVRLPGGRHVAGLAVGGQVEDVAVAAGGQHHRVAGVRFQRARDQVAGDNAHGPAVDHDQVHHLAAGEQFHPAVGRLFHERAVGAEQQLLARLAARVEGARHLRAAEGAVVEVAAVFAGEGNALRHALVDNGHAHLGQPVHVRLARPVVSPLDGVVKQAVNAVAVVLVVLGRVDAALRRNAVGPARRVVDAEGVHVVAHLGQRRRRGRPGQPRAHDQHGELALVRRVHQFHLVLVAGPFFGERAAGCFRIEQHCFAPVKVRTEDGP